MNDITLRVRQVFFKIGKSQSDFARELNITPAYVWKLLNKDDSSPSERLLEDICEKFNVNREWLETGDGDIFFTPTQNEKIADFMTDLLKEQEPSFRKRLVEALSVLDSSDWEDLERITYKMLKKD